MIRRPPRSTLFPYTTLFRSARFAKLEIGAGKPFDADKLPPDLKQAVEAGIAEVWKEDFAGLMNRLNAGERSEEHTSELQSPCNLVCRLLLEKKKKKIIRHKL